MPMLVATITSPRGARYIAAEPTPYGVEELRAHVRSLRTERAADTRLAIRLDAPSRVPVHALVGALAVGLAREGVRVVVADGQRSRAVVVKGTGKSTARGTPARPRKRR